MAVTIVVQHPCAGPLDRWVAHAAEDATVAEWFAARWPGLAVVSEPDDLADVLGLPAAWLHSGHGTVAAWFLELVDGIPLQELPPPTSMAQLIEHLLEAVADIEWSYNQLRGALQITIEQGPPWGLAFFDDDFRSDPGLLESALLAGDRLPDEVSATPGAPFVPCVPFDQVFAVENPVSGRRTYAILQLVDRWPDDETEAYAWAELVVLEGSPLLGAVAWLGTNHATLASVPELRLLGEHLQTTAETDTPTERLEQALTLVAGSRLADPWWREGATAPHVQEALAEGFQCSVSDHLATARYPAEAPFVGWTHRWWLFDDRWASTHPRMARGLLHAFVGGGALGLETAHPPRSPLPVAELDRRLARVAEG
ncbi:MAG: hypothetical protein AAF602_13495, partial [Myxococcota bacterium]